MVMYSCPLPLVSLSIQGFHSVSQDKADISGDDWEICKLWKLLVHISIWMFDLFMLQRGS